MTPLRTRNGHGRQNHELSAPTCFVCQDDLTRVLHALRVGPANDAPHAAVAWLRPLGGSTLTSSSGRDWAVFAR
eukprot:1161859-Pelagomonas_calceolata.AAC.15